MICCADFIQSFIALGITEHEKDKKADIAHMRGVEEVAKEDESRRNDALELTRSAEYCLEFSETDMENALLLLFDAARK